MTKHEGRCGRLASRDWSRAVAANGGSRSSRLLAAGRPPRIGTARRRGSTGTRSYEARDTLAAPADPVADAASCLRGLAWTPGRILRDVQFRTSSGVRRPGAIPFAHFQR